MGDAADFCKVAGLGAIPNGGEESISKSSIVFS